jgi:hypothetical protein
VSDESGGDNPNPPEVEPEWLPGLPEVSVMDDVPPVVDWSKVTVQKDPHPYAQNVAAMRFPPAGAGSPDMVNHPPHYTDHPSGVECIAIVEHMPFNRGSAIKYVWRAGAKGDEIEDLEKARWYLDREIGRMRKLRDQGRTN